MSKCFNLLHFKACVFITCHTFFCKTMLKTFVLLAALFTQTEIRLCGRNMKFHNRLLQMNIANIICSNCLGSPNKGEQILDLSKQRHCLKDNSQYNKPVVILALSISHHKGIFPLWRTLGVVYRP